MFPDICTSFRNCTDDSYCPECSHAHSLAEGQDSRGKTWRWSFNSRFGPLFLRKDGEPLVHQPIREGHPAWEPFEKWYKTVKEV